MKLILGCHELLLGLPPVEIARREMWLFLFRLLYLVLSEASQSPSVLFLVLWASFWKLYFLLCGCCLPCGWPPCPLSWDAMAFSLLSSGQLVRLTACCLGVFLQNLKVSLHFGQNKSKNKNPFILKGYRRHPKQNSSKSPIHRFPNWGHGPQINTIIYCNLWNNFSWFSCSLYPPQCQAQKSVTTKQFTRTH